jgi:adenylate cyclase
MRFFRVIQRWFRRKFGYARLVCLALLIGVAALRSADFGPIEELRVRTFDFYQRLDPRVKTSRPVTIVDIDEQSLKKLGQWPWPRTQIADLVINLTNMGALTIGFDVVFSEPDRLNPEVAAKSMRYLDEATRNRLRELPSNDQVLADAIRRTRVVLGETGLASLVSELDKDLPFTGIGSLGDKGSGPEPKYFRFEGLLRNVPVLEKAAAGRGLLTIVPERDGIIRRVPMLLTAQRQPMPSLTLEMLRVVSTAPLIMTRYDRNGIKTIGVKGFDIPSDKDGQFWVHFARRDPSIYVSAASVLDGTAPIDKIKGKLVLIGTSAATLNDLKTTPVSSVMPGVEVHAQVLEAALSHAVLTQLNYSVGIELIMAFVLGILVIIFAPNLGPITLAGVGALFATVLIGTSLYFYREQRLLIDFTYPLLSTTAIYLTLIFFSFVREQAQRRQIRSAFSQYISPVLVEQLVQSPEKLKLGGDEREMTIMFSDVRGFTSISESYKHDPQGLTALMNRFLTPLTDVILARKGTIDKYMGDAIMAFWNAPLDDAEHQINACHAALDMLEKVDALNKEREDEAQHGGHVYIPLNIGVGLNTGICVVGNMGSTLRKDYTVLGDSVNLASRLEGQSKEYGFPIIVGSKTALAAKDKFAILELDFIMVKGKKEPEVIYAVAGREDVARSAAFQTLRNMTIEMLASYRNRDWDGALLSIERGRRTDHAGTLDDLYRLYETRILNYRTNPPPDDWNGAFALLTK